MDLCLDRECETSCNTKFAGGLYQKNLVNVVLPHIWENINWFEIILFSSAMDINGSTINMTVASGNS
ncbi:hypothetical protein [Aquimarina latercula]|uniref:hypothetical protein n=1 Tax=Aquimarina latercula TaxID=987 RepID=UPI0004240D7D|nr:hypothetical protein [Aquimarina latercula]